MGWKLALIQNLYINGHSSFINNCQSLEASKKSFYKEMDKQMVVQP